MSIETELQVRSEGRCELCSTDQDLSVFAVPPHNADNADNNADTCIFVCLTCRTQIESTQELDVHHWRCLNESMWNQSPPVQVMAWRMLNRLSGESWARDLSDMLYLDEAVLAWAKQGQSDDNAESEIHHLDANGVTLTAGDTVTLIKDLNVKGASFTAKRGTAVRSISLVSDNAKHIEGRVNSQQIVILTEFVKKSN